MKEIFVAPLQFAGKVSHCNPNCSLRPVIRLVRDKVRISQPIPVVAQSHTGESTQLIAVPAILHVMAKLFGFFLLSGTAFSYTISGNKYLTDGSQADVQAACSAAPDNGSIVVVIPDGSFNWSGTLTINRSLTLTGADATGVKIYNDNASGDMISATASANGHINIYWLNIVQMADNSGGAGFSLRCDRAEPTAYTVLVHDCSFGSGSIYTHMVVCNANGIVFWNDTFVGDGPNDPNGLGGISFVCDKYGYTSSWNTPDTYGTQDTTGLANSYVEDCAFYDAASAISNFDDNSRVVWRHNTMSNCSLGSHGQETSLYGTREWEIYNNTFIYSSSGVGPSGNSYPLNMNDWFLARGGAGVIFDNQIADIPNNKNGISLTVFSINRSDSISCQTAYPAARQTGQGWSASSEAAYGNPVVTPDGTGDVTEGVYIWGNTGSETNDPHYVGLDQYTPDQCGNGKLATEFLQEGRDYFVGIAKPNYTPYQYPHPLHAQFALDKVPPPGGPTPPGSGIPPGSGVPKNFNNDGTADLIWENSVTGQLSFWFLKNGEPVSNSILAKVAPSWHVAGVGDFLGNGQSDLVWENSNGQHVIWIMSSGVPQYTIRLPTLAGGWHVVGAGDFNSDGKADLVWENTLSGKHEIWLMNNGVPTAAIPLARLGLNWHIAAVGDFLGNKQSDLVWQNSATGDRSIWLMENATPVSLIDLGIVGLNWQI
ncbi:MAG: VCBS repeat-containing protein, partial [Verrucomicrobia bacterium]|nr:VCBS repeat-containing protein [Verrucomicrobiota bacterium]